MKFIDMLNIGRYLESRRFILWKSLPSKELKESVFKRAHKSISYKKWYAKRQFNKMMFNSLRPILDVIKNIFG